MAVVPDTHDFAGGVVTTSEDNTYIRDPIRFLLNRPRAELRQTVFQTLTTGVTAAVTFDVEDVDADPSGAGGHSTSANTSRYTAVYAGWYLCGGGVGFAANVTGQRAAVWAVNGTLLNGAQIMEQATSASNNKVPARTKLILLNVGDYVELHALQTSGGNLNTDVTASGQSSMSVLWVSN